MIRQLCFLLSLALISQASFAQEEYGDVLPNTVFTGDYLEMVSGDTISEFHLLGNVTVTGTDLNLTSDELHITAVKKGDKDATVTTMGKIMNIIAIGSVKIIQEGRTAEAGRADLYPEEKKVLLTINPVVTDAQGTISGDEIEWFHGQRRAQVRGNTVVTLSVLPDLGYDPDAEPDPEAEASIEESEPSGEEIEEAPPTP